MKYSTSTQDKIKAKYFTSFKLKGYGKMSKDLDQSMIVNPHILHDTWH